MAYLTKSIQTMQLKIGELAQKTHVSTATLRYYEQCGLLSQANRADNGYRYYPEEAVQHVEFIKKAQQLGFSLQDVQAILKVKQAGLQPCGVVKQILAHKITQVQAQLRQLQQLEAELLQYQQQWQQDVSEHSTAHICQLIENVEIK